MTQFLETTVDKFTFKVATDRLYTDHHLWVRAENGLVRVGMTDYLQQRSGDVAFAEVAPAGARLARGDDLGTVETIKVTVVLSSPVSGAVREANTALIDAPEVVNQDPYGAGWLALVETDDWPADKAALIDAQAYLRLMQLEAEGEANKT